MSLRISGDQLSLIVAYSETGDLHLVWFGPKELEDMACEPSFQRLPASPDIPVGPGIMPEHGRGFHGIAQLEASCVATARRVRLTPPSAVLDTNTLVISARDETLGLHVTTTLSFTGDVLVSATTLHNEGAQTIHIERAASALLPSPDWADQVITGYGAWGREGGEDIKPWTAGRIEQAGRSGRPGFDGGPTLSVCETGTDHAFGRMLTVHLAWSGPFRLAAERATDGSGQVLAERLFAPGEGRLEPGKRLDLPHALIASSRTGRNGAAHRLHDYVREHSRPLSRPVHFNTWEARYFNLDEASCIELARSAASLGAERFVLDDGWFKGRRNDQTSLGDWTVDPVPFPSGFTPLIEAVEAFGMTFGLWVEPEMVSPDSDLYRAHPDWVLGYPDPDLTTGRNQLMLDLALPPVQAYLYDSIAALLDTYRISYLKWDHNRDLYPAMRDGRPRPGAQTLGLYSLLDRIRSAYPVEIESCASGGGRIDAGIARRTDRFWTSDATDAIDRLRIQRSASRVMPPERLGAHVGPSPNPMTGRQIPMAFRVLTALFGHFGIEVDPDTLTTEEADILTRGIEIYKSHRHWMSTGRLHHLSHNEDDPDICVLVAADGTQGLARVLRILTPPRPLQPRLRLAGLDLQARYKVAEIALSGEPVLWPIGEYSGAGLMSEGLPLDPGRALTGRLIHLERSR